MTLSSAAADALGTTVPAQPNRLAWVDVESGPDMVAVLDIDEVLTGYYPKIDDSLGLTHLMADLLRTICDKVDENECQSSECFASPYERNGVPVGKSIGWVVAGEADERTEWSQVTLIQMGSKVIAVCDDCSPSAAYQDLWPTP